MYCQERHSPGWLGKWSLSITPTDRQSLVEKLVPRGEARKRWVGVSLEASRWLGPNQMMPM